MPGLVPGIHAFLSWRAKQDVDGRDEPGHDGNIFAKFSGGWEMHEAAKLQFDRIGTEYATWRAVAEEDRAPAPAWWWGPAMDALDQTEVMSPPLCAKLELAAGSSYGVAAELLMAALAGQTSLSLPDEFPKMFRPAEPV